MTTNSTVPSPAGSPRSTDATDDGLHGDAGPPRPAGDSPAAAGPTWSGRLRDRRVRRALLVAAGIVLLALALVVDKQSVQALLLGAGSGSLIAALALGVVVTYRGSGVLNLGVGAMAMYASYVFNSLNTQGQLLLIGWKLDLGGPMALVPAVLLTTIIAGAMGAVLYRLIFAPLRDASPVAKVVAAVGVLLTLQAIIVLAYGSAQQSVTAQLSSDSVSLPFGLAVPVNQVLLGAFVLVLATALWAIYRFTPFGLATRAAAEDERNLTLIGWSPTLVSGGNWVFSGVVVALIAVLAAPINGAIDPTTVTLLVVPALAAALLGGLTSFGWAAVGGIGIGMLQALVQYLSTKGWFPKADGAPLPGVREALPFLIIVVTLFFGRRGISGRGAIGTVRLPAAPEPGRFTPKILVLSIAAIVLLLVVAPDWRLAGINSLVGIAVCLSFVVLTGFVGQVSLGQMALAGISGFVLAKVSTGVGIGFPFAPLIGMLGAGVVGLLAALPALRVRGVQLAIVTLAAATAIETFVFNNPLFTSGIATTEVPSPSLLGEAFGPTDVSGLGDGKLPDPLFGIFCVVIVAALAWLTCSLRTSSMGRRMLAVRANERAAAAAGISVARTKVVAFALSAMIAGTAGALSGYRFGSVTPEYFGAVASLSFLAFAYMGGISSVTGAVIGGVLVTNGLMFTALRDWFGVSPSYSLLIGGLGLIITVVANPDGIAGSFRQIRIQLGRRLAARPGSRGPGTPASEAPIEMEVRA